MPTDPVVYCSELRHLGHGLPVYEPNPSGYDCVRVGDVGYVDKFGYFERVFNIFYPDDDPINARYGVPDGFTAVTDPKYREVRRLNGLQAGTYKSQYGCGIDVGGEVQLSG